MAKPKIFIASSGRTLELAKQLRDELNPDYCEPELWTEAARGKMSYSILAMLKEATQEYDFAVIILSQDDVMVTQLSDNTRKARDNCVFEAGLFMGAIGETGCLLLSSVAASDLPSDLGGIIYQSFKEPSDLTDSDACRKAIVTAVTRIESMVRKPQPRGNRPLSKARLLEREKSIQEGGELLMDQVVVTSSQPLDLGYDAARQVRMNIDQYNVSYVYFFEGSEDGADKTCQLLQIMLLANILKNGSDANNWPIRLQELIKNKVIIKKDLIKISKYGRIKIFFLPAPPALQFCIHNARTDKSATLYLQRGEEFIEWKSGEGAYQFWDEIRRARGALYPDPPNAVFYGVPGFDIYANNFFNVLKSAVHSYFPGMEQAVMNICLGSSKASRRLELTQPLRGTAKRQQQGQSTGALASMGLPGGVALR